MVAVPDRRSRHLGQALYSPRSEIRLRLLTRGREPVNAGWWGERIAAAAGRRAGLAATAFRVVHAEGDGLPSLVVDRYGPYVVAQLLSAGVEQRRGDGGAGLPSGPAPARAPPPHDVALCPHGGVPLAGALASREAPEGLEAAGGGLKDCA